MYRNLPKISPPSKIRPPPSLAKSYCKGSLLFKSMPAPQTRLATHFQNDSEEWKTDCCHHLVVCCYSKCTFLSSYDWEGTSVLEWLMVMYMYTTCRVGVLLSEISKHSKINPPPSLRSHLTSSPMGILSEDYGIIPFITDPTTTEAETEEVVPPSQDQGEPYFRAWDRL